MATLSKGRKPGADRWSSRKAAQRPPAPASFTLSWDGTLPGPVSQREIDFFRERVASGLLDELCITFRPCILGGKSAPAITDPAKGFLPRGIVLELLAVRRTADGIRARYRVRRGRR